MKIDKIPSMVELDLPKPCCDCQHNTDVSVRVGRRTKSSGFIYRYDIEINCSHQSVCKYLEKQELFDC